MKINAKDLCSIKDIQELKSVDSINNILKVINSEITPMSVTAQTYEEWLKFIIKIELQINQNVLLILLIWRSLEKMSILNIIIQIIHRMKKDTNNLKKNIKNKVYVLELWDSKCIPLTQSIVKRFKNRSSLHPLN